MIDYGESIDIKGNLEYFENYMFIITEKHIKKHTNSLHECCIYDNGVCIKKGIGDLDFRKEVKNEFNNILFKKGINYKKGHPNMQAMLIYVPKQAQNVVLTILSDYTKELGNTAAVVCHNGQMTEDGSGIFQDHIHVLYDSKYCDCLKTFLDFVIDSICN